MIFRRLTIFTTTRIRCGADERVVISAGFTLFTRSEVRSRASCRHYIAYLYDRARMRMLIHDNIEQKDMKYKANVNTEHRRSWKHQPPAKWVGKYKSRSCSYVVLYDIYIVN